MSKMRKLALCAAFAALPMANATAAGDFSATVGLKAWFNNWNTWAADFAGAFNDPATDPAVVNRESKSTESWIPSVSIRFKDFMVGGSYFVKRSYGFNPTFGDVKREEYDLIGGYYVLPTLAVIAGYKEVDQWFGREKWKFTGPIIGLTASAPLSGGFSLYGTGAYGQLDVKTSIWPKTDASYRLGELGVAYAFDTGGGMGMKSLIGTFGYRSQSIITKLKSDWTGLKGRDTTEGFTIGVVGAF